VEHVGFVGAGRAGTGLARGLAAAGWRVCAVSSRTSAHAERLAARLPAARALADAQAVADCTDIVFLTVPDAAIAGVAESVAWRGGQAVVHASGAESLAPLRAAARRGALVGSLHPLQAFACASAAAADPLAPFAGITCGIEADPALTARLHAMSESLGARGLALPAGAKPLYHAAAVMASNHVVTLLHQAADLWGALGFSEGEARAALLPLVRGTIDNVAAHGAVETLTGPVARGDATTVEKHVRALAAARSRALDAYRVLARATLDLALRRGELNPAAAEALKAVLAEADAAGVA